MATFTATQSGLRSSAATWGGAGVPGSSDIADIPDTFVVTFNDNLPVGSISIRAPGVATASNGIIVAAGTQLTVKDDLTWGGSLFESVPVVDLQAGAILESDGSAHPAVRNFIGSHDNFSGRRIRAQGSVGSPCIIRSNAGGLPAYINDNAHVSTGSFECYHTDFNYIGDATQYAMYTDLQNSFGQMVIFEDCTWTNCGEQRVFGPTATDTSIVRYRRCYDVSPAGTNSLDLRASQPTAAVGERSMDACVWQKPVLSLFGGYAISNTLFAGNFRQTVAGPQMMASWQNNVVISDFSAAGFSGGGSDTYWMMTTGGVNPHFIANYSDADMTLDGWLLHYLGTNGEGNGFEPQTNGSVRYKINYRRCIVLPDVTGANGSTDLTTLGGANNPYADVEHCTLIGGPVSISLDENLGATAGQMTSYKSNISHRFAVQAPFGPFASSASSTDNIADPANINHNCNYNYSPAVQAGKTSNGTPYNLPTTGVVPGANDVNVDPQFVELTRNLLTWGQTVYGTDGSLTQALAALAVDPAVRIPAMLSWVRGGFAPQNVALRFAAEDGTTIGAEEYVSLSTTGLIRKFVPGLSLPLVPVSPNLTSELFG